MCVESLRKLAKNEGLVLAVGADIILTMAHIGAYYCPCSVRRSPAGSQPASRAARACRRPRRRSAASLPPGVQPRKKHHQGNKIQENL